MLGETKNFNSSKKSTKLPKLDIQSKIQNQQIAQRMQRKIQFTRNPRHLTQTISYAQAFNTITSQKTFRIQPSQIQFKEYNIHHLYQSQVKLINQTQHIQRLKITPLRQKQFVISKIKYPRDDSGDIAPGMAVIITIRFRPPNQGDFSDQLFLIVGDGVVKIPIIAHKEIIKIEQIKKQQTKIQVKKQTVKQIQYIQQVFPPQTQERDLQIFPLHRKITKQIYKQSTVIQSFTLYNYTSSPKTFTIQKILQQQNVKAECNLVQGSINPNQPKSIQISFTPTQLFQTYRKAFFLVTFQGQPAQIFSIQGKPQKPDLLIQKQTIYFGLCRTYTLNKKEFKIKNIQNSPVKFKIINNNRFYNFDFHQFYTFQNEQSFTKKINLYNSQGQQLIEQITMAPNSQMTIECNLNTLQQQSINTQCIIEIKDGKNIKIDIISEVQDCVLQLNRQVIKLKQIYKGNVYNSNKFLARQLQLINQSHLQINFQIDLPPTQFCQFKIQPTKGILKANSKQRLDLNITPIKTGPFDATILIKYIDSFKNNPSNFPLLNNKIKFNQQLGKKYMNKQLKITFSTEVKGMTMNYYLKDQTKAKKIKTKMTDDMALSINQSMKISSSSQHTLAYSKSSHKTLMQNQKIIYPTLESLRFYNCQINTVKQLQIIIQNDSELTTQYQIYAQNYFSLQKAQIQKKSNKGLIGKQQAFTSQLGKTFIKQRVLDRSQKVHLNNNKGISIFCEPSHGVLHKKQTQKIMISLFNDTSGRFTDNLIIQVKDHQRKAIPIQIQIIGSPLCLSKNQLGINFNQQIPIINLGKILINKNIKKTLKISNNGPKKMGLKWFIYPYSTIPEGDLINIQFLAPSPGSNQDVRLVWNALKPQVDKNTLFKICPSENEIAGRQQIKLELQFKGAFIEGQYCNLLICQPYALQGNKVQPLAAIVKCQVYADKIIEQYD